MKCLKYCTINKRSKGMCEQLIKGYACWRCRKWCLWLLDNTAYRVLLLMSEVLKVIVLCIQWPLTPARREGYLSLLSWGFSCLKDQKAMYVGGVESAYRALNTK